MLDEREETNRDGNRGAGSEPERAERGELANVGEPACPACGGRLVEIRAKLQCSRCHRICEGCCEGGPG
jgi:hypothetical protein